MIDGNQFLVFILFSPILLGFDADSTLGTLWVIHVIATYIPGTSKDPEMLWYLE